MLDKHRRRIRRFIMQRTEYGDDAYVPRVYATDDPNVFEYRTVHHVLSHFYKRDKLGRLRLIEGRKVT